MTTASPFGLYPSRDCLAAQRLSAPHALALDTPVPAGAVTLFRSSLWLPVPAALRGSTRLALAGSTLGVRFAPTTLQLPTTDEAWFSRADSEDDNRTARLQFVWPASVTQLADPPGYHAESFKLYRVDGERVADEATMSGTTAAPLDVPWIGSPMQVVMDRALPPRIVRRDIDIGPQVVVGASPAAASAARGAGAQGPASDVKDAGRSARRIAQRSQLVPAVTVAGVPSTPRLRLTLEARGEQPEALLWQALLPGEQGTVELPPGALADEWAPALEQLRKRLADESPPLAAPLLLRLDIESDAPCAVTLTQLTLALDEERELLAAEARLDFGGTRAQTQPLALAWPAAAPQSLVLAGRIDGGTDAPASIAPLSDTLRRGLLLQAPCRVRVPATLAAPARVAGLSIAWHALSEALTLTLRVLPDSGARPLLEHKLVLDTPAAGWLALRALPVDLQAGALWLELVVDEGSGLWLATDAATPAASGWTETMAGGEARRQPLGLMPGWVWLPAPTASDQPRRVALMSGSQVLAPDLDARFELDCPAAALATLPSQGLQLHSASAGRVTLQSARARLRVL